MSKALPLVRFPVRTSVHRFGAPSGASRSSALLRFDDGLTISREGRQGLAIVGDGEGRRLAVETLLSRHRIQPIPPPPGLFPYITSITSQSSASTSGTDIPIETPKLIRHLAFARPPPTGDFTDFTARYGALQEEDRLSFRQTLSALNPTPSAEEIEEVAKVMKIHHLLDLPSVSLSSGQTRRARIAAAILTKPVLLLLEDPMAGLDVGSREEVSRTLGELNARGDIRIALVQRGKGKGDVPDWITDVCEVRDGNVWVGPRSDWEETREDVIVDRQDTTKDQVEGSSRDPVVRLQDVFVSYGEGTRPVLKDVSWSIRPGEKWHLQGANGSGKTTLLSLVLGHHPRSFSLPASALTLFDKPRRETPTPTLRKLIGHTSPEIYASFPRGMGLSALAAVGSGFEGVFSRRELSSHQKERILGMLEYFKDLLATGRSGSGSGATTRDLALRLFAQYTPPQQALLLFLRAMVARSPLVILDEPAQGMDEVIWQRCCEFLEKEWKEYPDQAVVVVSHYEDEVPWSRSAGKVYRLIDGVGRVIE